MTIVIFLGRSSSDKAMRYRLAEFISRTNKTLTFSIQEWIPPAIDAHYYVRTETPKDGLESLVEISVYAHTDVRPPYIYTVEYREKWSGFLENAETDDKEEEA